MILDIVTQSTASSQLCSQTSITTQVQAFALAFFHKWQVMTHCTLQKNTAASKDKISTAYSSVVFAAHCMSHCHKLKKCMTRQPWAKAPEKIADCFRNFVIEPTQQLAFSAMVPVSVSVAGVFRSSVNCPF